MRHQQRTLSVRPLVLLAIAATLGGCASRTSASTRTSTSATTAADDAAHAATACTPNDVAISLGRGGAAGGHVGAVLLFTNHGSRTCELTGYPHVEAAGGLAVRIQQNPGGYLGGLTPPSTPLPHIDLTPGQIASAYVEGTDSPVPATAHCPAPAGSLALWLPGYSRPVPPTEIADPAGTCSVIQIHPVVPGSSGRLVSPTPSQAPVSAACTDAQLTVRFDRGLGVAMGSAYFRIVLTNRSSGTCTVAGEAQVRFEDSGHHTVSIPVDGDGSTPASITLEPGGSASENLAFSSDGNPPPGKTSCGSSAAVIEITAPGGTAAHEFPFAGAVCPHSKVSLWNLVAGADASP